MSAKSGLTLAPSGPQGDGDDGPQLNTKAEMWMHMLELVRTEAIFEGQRLLGYLVDMAMAELKQSMESQGNRKRT